MRSIRSCQLDRRDWSRRGQRSFTLELLERRALFSINPLSAATTAAHTASDAYDLALPVDLGSPVPVFNSDPGASTAVYLDFNGNSETLVPYAGAQYTNGTIDATTKPFDLDGNLENFSPAEVAAIQEICLRVSEDFAPFRVNVTTERSQYQDHGGVRVAIGGEWNDFNWPDKEDCWGVKLSFDWGPLYPGNHSPDTVWVFSETIWDDISATPGDIARHVADTASHEAGHHFGLAHQMLFDADGMLLEEYNPGNSRQAPIMGDSGDTLRSTWWVGDTFGGSPPSFEELTDMIPDEEQWWLHEQDDIARLRSRLGGRTDDHGGEFSSATPLTLTAGSSSAVSPHFIGQGLIEKTTDADYFSFEVNALSQATIRLDVAAVGPNLTAALELWSIEHAVSPSGMATTLSRLVGEANPDDLIRGLGFALQRSNDLGAGLSATLEPGDYVLVARGDGGAGDAGRYQLNVDLAPLGPLQLVGSTLNVYGSNDTDVATIGVAPTGNLVATLTRYNAAGSTTGVWEANFPLAAVAQVVFRGYDGNDRLNHVTSLPVVAYGGAGNDLLMGGNAVDRLFGEAGQDTLRGYGGNDELYGDDGIDFLYGGFGNDLLRGDDGADFLYGEAGADTLYGGAGHDLIYGGTEHDFIYGDAGNDTLSGDDGNDLVQGGDDHDSLLGGNGIDTLNGDAGNDYLDGGYDGLADLLRGGSGADRFVRHRTGRPLGRATTWTNDPDSFGDFSTLFDQVINVDHI